MRNTREKSTFTHFGIIDGQTNKINGNQSSPIVSNLYDIKKTRAQFFNRQT